MSDLLSHARAFVIVALTAFGALQAQIDTLEWDDLERTYLLRLPDAYSGSEELPLVIAMHGGFGNALQFESRSLLSEKANAENFIVVYPEGFSEGLLPIPSWNAGWCCGYASNNNIDDVGFINALLDRLIANYAIDPDRIYATGFSNGGFMAYRLACELSQRIAAIAPVGASMSLNQCEPQRPVPVISIHSYLDTNVPIEGGIGTGPSGHYNPPQDSVLHIVWSGINDCLVSKDTLIFDDELTHVVWRNCDCRTEIQQYITRDGGHSWPGGDPDPPTGDPVSDVIVANDLIWDFFSRFSLDCPPVGIESSGRRTSGLVLFPNPTNGLLTIIPGKAWGELRMTVFNIVGKKVASGKNRTTINLQTQANGIYFIRIEMDGQVEMHKVLKFQ
jgi:polyhydroxybutyrate depolymerase